MERYYDTEVNFLYAKEEKIAKRPLFDHVTGGLMIVERKLWEELGGMDERLIRNQDLDFGLRMSKIGFPVLKDNHYWIIHHTISYLENSRFSYFYKSKALLSPGILMRKHIFNFTYLKYFRRYVFYVLLLLTSFALLFISPVYGILLLLFYLFIQLIRTIVNSKREEYFIKSFAYKTLFNIYSLLGFLFYYPAKPSYRLTIIK
jgi:GT2 family glycosyltransferase